MASNTSAEPLLSGEPHLSEESQRARALAARVRALQASFADDSAATRRDFISQEIEQALKGFVPEKRRRVLTELADLFPAGQGGASSQSRPVAEAAPAPETPETLLDRLLEALPGLSPLQRVALAERLRAAGLIPESSGAAFELPPELQKRLGVEGRPLAEARAAKTFIVLLDVMLALDQLAWTLWKQVAARSVVRREADLTRLAAEYPLGSSEVSTAQVTQTTERMRKLIASLMGSTAKGGDAFARDWGQLFDPAAIEPVARAEKKVFESVEFACWRKYKELYEAYGARDKIEKALREQLVKAAESLMLGRPVV